MGLHRCRECEKRERKKAEEKEYVFQRSAYDVLDVFA
jgi:hypothetical protein